jgi:hypothetical protein
MPPALHCSTLRPCCRFATRFREASSITPHARLPWARVRTCQNIAGKFHANVMIPWHKYDVFVIAAEALNCACGHGLSPETRGRLRGLAMQWSAICRFASNGLRSARRALLFQRPGHRRTFVGVAAAPEWLFRPAPLLAIPCGPARSLAGLAWLKRSVNRKYTVALFHIKGCFSATCATAWAEAALKASASEMASVEVHRCRIDGCVTLPLPRHRP